MFYILDFTWLLLLFVLFNYVGQMYLFFCFPTKNCKITEALEFLNSRLLCMNLQWKLLYFQIEFCELNSLLRFLTFNYFSKIASLQLMPILTMIVEIIFILKGENFYKKYCQFLYYSQTISF